jgi:hypothetical protein
VRAILGTAKSDCLNPLIDKSSVLARAEVAGMVNSARKSVVVGRAAATFEPSEQARSDIGCQLELHGLSGLPLDDDRSGPDVGPRYEITNLDFHQVAAAQLAVDRQVEQRPVANAAFAIQEEANGPDLLLRQRALGADGLARVPRRPALRSRIIM